MGTSSAASYTVPAAPPHGVAEAGCFCVLRTPRNMQDVLARIGDVCTAERLGSTFANSHPRYKELNRYGLIVVEQRGSCGTEQHQQQSSPLDSSKKSSSLTAGNVQVVLDTRGWTRRNGTKSFGCQVCAV